MDGTLRAGPGLDSLLSSSPIPRHLARRDRRAEWRRASGDRCIRTPCAGSASSNCRAVSSSATSAGSRAGWSTAISTARRQSRSVLLPRDRGDFRPSIEAAIPLALRRNQRDVRELHRPDRAGNPGRALRGRQGWRCAHHAGSALAHQRRAPGMVQHRHDPTGRLRRPRVAHLLGSTGAI